MGYEMKLIIGKASGLKSPEHILDMDKPFSDGSGYEYKKDASGNYALTGRTATFFQVMAEIDLCKIGSGPLSSLVVKAHKMAKEAADCCFYFFGTTDGNKEAKEDHYEDKLHPVPIADVLTALKEEGDTYRRYSWVIALLEAMKDDPEELQVMFWGH